MRARKSLPAPSGHTDSHTLGYIHLGREGGGSLTCAGILEQSTRARNRLGIGLFYWSAWLHGPAESIPWNRCQGPLKVLKFGSLISVF